MADRAMRLGAYALCMDESGRLLLARISAGLPDAGAWTLPGGGIDHGESPDLAVERELQEETGLLPHAVHGVVGVYSKTYEVRGPHGAFHHVGIVYRVATSGDPQPEADGSTDLSGWFTREEIGGITLTPLGEFGCSLAWPATTNGGGTR